MPDLGGTQLRTGGHAPGSNGSPLIPHIALPSSPTRVKRNSRVRLAPDSVSPSNSVMSESRWGTALSSFSSWVTRKRITSAVLSWPMRFLSVTSSPTSYLGEIYDHVETLRLRDGDRAVADRRAQQTTVAADLDEGCVSRLQGELVAAGVGSVEDAKAVLRVGDLHYRPWRAVDQDRVPENPVHVVILDARLVLERGV